MWMDGGSYVANGLAYATAATALAVFAVGLAVLIRGRGSNTTTPFFLLTVCAAGWLGGAAMMYSSTDAATAFAWSRIGGASACLIPAAFFQFAAVSAGRKMRSAIYAAWAVCFVLAVVGTSTSLAWASMHRYSWGYYPAAGRHGMVWVVAHALIFAAAIGVFWRTYRSVEGIGKERASALMLSFILGAIGMVDYLPSSGVDVYPIGYVAALAFTIVAGTAVWRYRLVDLTPEYAASQILETMKGAVLVIDMHGRVRVANRAACEMLGYTVEELIGESLRKVIDPSEEDSTAKLLQSTGVLERHMLWRTASGTQIDVLASSSYVRADDGAPVGVVYAATDFTERRRAERLLRESETRYRLLFERNLAGVYRATTDGKVLDCNDACARIFGCESREDFLSRPSSTYYFSEEDRERLVAKLREQKSVTNFEVKMRRRDGTVVWVLENLNFLEGADGQPDVMEGTIIDITARKQQQEQVEYQAYHDMLTGLPNRLLFRDRIAMALAHAKRTSRCVAVMFLDLDEFKNVNDTRGHNVGDRLLQAVALRLVGSVRAEDTVARMGGDEFTVLLSDIADRRGASTVAQKLLEAVRHPMTFDGEELKATTSIGIAIYPEDGTDAETLLRTSDRAMYRAKELGRNNFQFANALTEDDKTRVTRRLQHALAAEQFVVHYQPMVEIASGRVVGAEALVRWHDPEKGLTKPDDFVPLAEASDLIIPIGEWVLRRASEQLRQWHDAGHRLRMAVNLSPRQFQQRDLPEMIERVLAESGVSPEYLDLEITESAAMHNVELSLETMLRLKEMGVRISIDDFGTGYSSLSYLKHFPVDTVKIDQDFVRDLTHDSNDRAIISAVISMARALKLRVIAEGVETQEQLAFLQHEECGEMQGFLHSRPLPAEEFETLLRKVRDAQLADAGRG